MRAESLLHYPYLLIPLAIGVALILVIAAFLLRRRGAGRQFEKVVRRVAVSQLRDIVIPDGIGGHIHIERLLLTDAGALIVEFKDVPGTIFAGDRLDEWPVMNGKGRHTFRNPLGPLQDRIAAVRTLVPDLPADGKIVFSDAGRFPKGMPDKVCLLSDFAAGPGPDAQAEQHYAEAWERLTAQIEVGGSPVSN